MDNKSTSNNSLLTGILTLALAVSLGANAYLYSQNQQLKPTLKVTKRLDQPFQPPNKGIELGGIIKHVLTDPYWVGLEKYFTGGPCALGCQGTVSQNVLTHGKIFSTSSGSDKIDYYAGGSRPSVDFIQFMMKPHEAPLSEEIVASIKGAGLTIKKIECYGDLDFINENNINMAGSGVESPLPNYYKISLSGHDDALFVENIIDVEHQKEVMWLYTDFSMTTNICTQGVR